MKAKPRIFKAALTLCGCLAVAAASGQTTFTWTNSAGGNIATATNWNPNGVPSPTSGADPLFGDEMLWDGQTTGDLSLTATSGQVGSSGNPWGLRLRLSSNQTGAVNIHSPVSQSSGTRMNSITIESGAGQFSLGDNTANVLDTLWGGAGGVTHTWVNNSANPVVIYPNVRWRYGGGGFHNFDFGGTGDWIVNNYFRHNNPPAGTGVTKSGTGTMTWTGTNFGAGAISANQFAGPLIINGGTLILKSPDLLGNAAVQLDPSGFGGTLLKYDAPTGAGTISGTISGGGPFEVHAGTLTLSGNNTFTSELILSGGTVIAGRAENPDNFTGPFGYSGLITFSGGALGFSANNTFDYSARFNSAADQQYKFDTRGQNVTFTNSLVSSGGTLTKIGPGTLTLDAPSSYTGETVVTGGRLVFAGTKSGSGNITIASGAALGVSDGGSQVTPGTLSLGASTLEFNNVSSTTTAPLSASTLTSSGLVTINVNSGTFAVGQSYPLLSWTTGPAPAVSLGAVIGAVGNLSTNGNTIRLNVTELALIWSGANSGTWDASTPNNWRLAGSSVTYSDPSAVAFGDSASGSTDVAIAGVVQPATVTFNNSTKQYSLTTSAGNNIGGTASLTKSGSGTLTVLGGANSYSGISSLVGGTLSAGVLANGGAPSDIGASGSGAQNLVLNGGRLQYTGAAASIDRLFSVGTGGGTIEASGSGALMLNNTGKVGLTGQGARVLTLTGTNAENNTLAASLEDNGGPTSLTKSGTGTWVLTGNNTNSGATTVSAGVLQVGAGGAGGTLGTGDVLNNGNITFNRTGTVTVEKVISGTGTLTNAGPGTVVLTENNTFSGATTISGGTLQLGNGGDTGRLASGAAIVNDGLLIFNSTGSHTYNGAISGSGNVIAMRGYTKAIGANSYTGWTRIDPGATFVPTEGNTGAFTTSSAVTNNGTLRFMAYDTRAAYYGNIVGTGRVEMGANNATFDAGDIVLAGTNSYTGGTYIGGNHLIFGDGTTFGAGTLVGDVYFVNNFETPDDTVRRLIFNRPEDFTFGGNIVTNFTSPQNNRGIVQQNGFGVLTLTGNNTYASGTVINAGTIQVGNGGTSGSIGTGPVTDNGLLIWNRSNDDTFPGAISGAGSFVKTGSGKLTLTGNSTFTGDTTVSNGVLLVNGTNTSFSTWVYGGTLGGTGGFSGGVYLNPGAKLAPGASVGTLTMDQLYIYGGNMEFEVNKSLAQSNDVVNIISIGAYYGFGDTLNVVNTGPALKVGDKFQLFTLPLQSGESINVTGAGATWKNDLGVDGTITALTVTTPTTPDPTNIVFSATGNQLTLNWPANVGWILQVQTNSLTTGLSTNWYDVPDTGGGTGQKVINIDPNGPTVFFRLKSQ